MPRFVRNAYIEGSADGVATPFGTGPRNLGGWLSARITLRTADAGVSDAIVLTAGGRENGSNAAHAFLTIPAGMMIAETGARPDGSVEVHIVQRIA
jgi:hypothetical protein